jgi:O-antigen/teichoic acid export membrane protein
MDESIEDWTDKIRQLVRDFGIYSVANVIPAVLGLVGLLVFTRAFSPDAFGRYSVVMAVVGIFSTFLFGWLDYSIIRFAPEMDTDAVVGNVFTMFVTVAAALVALALLGFELFGGDLGEFRVFYFACLILILANGFFQATTALFRATLRSEWVTIFRVTNAVVKLLASLVLALVVLNHIVGWLWGAIIGFGVAVLVMIVTSPEIRTRPRVDRDKLVRLSVYGLPMLGWIIGEPMLNHVDRLLLEVLVGSAAVGIYTSNYMIVDQGLRLVYVPILEAMGPIIFNSWEDSRESEIASLLRDFSRYFILLGVPVLVLVAALSKPLSTLMLGAEFHEGFVVIPIVSSGVFLWSLANLGQLGFEVKERTVYLSIGLILTVIINVALNIPLIGAFGYVGAAAATTISYGAYAVFIRAMSSRGIRWRFPTRSFGVAFAGGVLMGIPAALVYGLGMATAPLVIASAVLGIPLYIGVLYSVGEFTDAELDIVRNLV